MGEHYSHLSLAERRQIDAMFQASIRVREIAARLGRHPGTIHRELNRNFYHTSFRDRFGNDYRGYFCLTANAMAKGRRRSGRVKLLRHPALLAHVVAKLRSGWSPQQVSGRLKIDPQPVGRISHESIYRHIYSADGRVRRRLPLDSPVADRSATGLSAIATRMNDTPRKCLGWQTPAEPFSSKLAPIKRTDYNELQPCRTSA